MVRGKAANDWDAGEDSAIVMEVAATMRASVPSISWCGVGGCGCSMGASCGCALWAAQVADSPEWTDPTPEVCPAPALHNRGAC